MRLEKRSMQFSTQETDSAGDAMEAYAIRIPLAPHERRCPLMADSAQRMLVLLISAEH